MILTFFFSLNLGCDFKLHYDLDKDCASQCQTAYTETKLRASCQVGCTLSPTVNKVLEKPAVAVDPVPVRSLS